MNETKKKLKEGVLLRDLYNFIATNGKTPKVKDFTPDNGFSNCYKTYFNHFGSMTRILNTCGFIHFPKPKKPKQTPKKKKALKKNLMSNKIRLLLKKNRDANYEELKAICGKVTRSVIITYYRIYKELYKVSGSLHKEKNADSNRSKVLTYFKAHPGSTIYDVMKEFDLSWRQVYTAIYGLNAKYDKIVFKRTTNNNRYRGKALRIREYMEQHPSASLKECACKIGTSYGYVTLVLYKERKKRRIENQEEAI